MNNKNFDKEYWSIRNRIGYTVISGDKTKRKELETELKTLLKKA